MRESAASQTPAVPGATNAVRRRQEELENHNKRRLEAAAVDNEQLRSNAGLLLQQELTERSAAMECMQKERERLQQELEASRAAETERSAEVSSLQQQLTTSDGTNKQLQQELEASRAAEAERIAEVKSLQQQLKQELEASCAAVAERSAEVSSLQQQLMTSISTNERLQQELEILSAAVAAHEAELGRLGQEKLQLQRFLEEAQLTIRRLQPKATIVDSKPTIKGAPRLKGRTVTVTFASPLLSPAAPIDRYELVAYAEEAPSSSVAASTLGSPDATYQLSLEIDFYKNFRFAVRAVDGDGFEQAESDLYSESLGIPFKPVSVCVLTTGHERSWYIAHLKRHLEATAEMAGGSTLLHWTSRPSPGAVVLMVIDQFNDSRAPLVEHCASVLSHASGCSRVVIALIDTSASRWVEMNKTVYDTLVASKAMPNGTPVFLFKGSGDKGELVSEGSEADLQLLKELSM